MKKYLTLLILLTFMVTSKAHTCYKLSQADLPSYNCNDYQAQAMRADIYSKLWNAGY